MLANATDLTCTTCRVWYEEKASMNLSDHELVDEVLEEPSPLGISRSSRGEALGPRSQFSFSFSREGPRKIPFFGLSRLNDGWVL